MDVGPDKCQRDATKEMLTGRHCCVSLPMTIDLHAVGMTSSIRQLARAGDFEQEMSQLPTRLGRSAASVLCAGRLVVAAPRKRVWDTFVDD